MAEPKKMAKNERLTIWEAKIHKFKATYGDTNFEEWCIREAERIRQTGQPCKVEYRKGVRGNQCCIREDNE